MVLAYEPYGALRRIENWWHIDISCFKRGGKDGDEERTEEKIDEGRDGRELHDDCSEWDIAKVCKRVDVAEDMGRAKGGLYRTPTLIQMNHHSMHHMT